MQALPLFHVQLVQVLVEARAGPQAVVEVEVELKAGLALMETIQRECHAHKRVCMIFFLMNHLKRLGSM